MNRREKRHHKTNLFKIKAQKVINAKLKERKDKADRGDCYSINYLKSSHLQKYIRKILTNEGHNVYYSFCCKDRRWSWYKLIEPELYYDGKKRRLIQRTDSALSSFDLLDYDDF